MREQNIRKMVREKKKSKSIKNEMRKLTKNGDDYYSEGKVNIFFFATS